MGCFRKKYLKENICQVIALSLYLILTQSCKAIRWYLHNLQTAETSVIGKFEIFEKIGTLLTLGGEQKTDGGILRRGERFLAFR